MFFLYITGSAGATRCPNFLAHYFLQSGILDEWPIILRIWICCTQNPFRIGNLLPCRVDARQTILCQPEQATDRSITGSQSSTPVRDPCTADLPLAWSKQLYCSVTILTRELGVEKFHVVVGPVRCAVLSNQSFNGVMRTAHAIGVSHSILCWLSKRLEITFFFL